MSAPSGIKVPPALTEAFSDAQRDASNVRALVFTIDGESFQHADTIKPEGSYTDDIARLPAALPTKQTPASFAYRLDSRAGGSYEWMMVTFVPDDAGVRAKMLQASSRAGLMKALGANNFKHDWFATSVDDLSPRALKSHLEHMTSPPPLTASEAALAEVKAAEAEEARRSALDAELNVARRKAVIGLGGKTKWQEGVADALTKAAQRSDDGWIVTLEISSTDTAAINLLRSEACKPSEVASKVPEKSPAYVFYSFPTPPPPKPTMPSVSSSAPAQPRNLFQATAGGARPVQASSAPRMDDDKADDEKKTDDDEAMAEDKESKAEDKAEGDDATEEAKEENGDKTPDVTGLNVSEEPEPTAAARSPSPEAPSKGRVVFIYWCPSGSPVKFRMVYSTTVRSIQQDAADKAGIEVVGKLETSDKSDLSESALRDAVPSKPTKSTSAPGAPQMFGAPAPPGRFGSPSSFNVPSPGGSSRLGSSNPSSPPVFGAPAAFGAPRPIRTGSGLSTGSGNASPAAASPAAADADDGDSKDRIQNAFNAFGPRVGGASGGGFSRPRPAGRR